jgi:hypothetical protein
MHSALRRSITVLLVIGIAAVTSPLPSHASYLDVTNSLGARNITATTADVEWTSILPETASVLYGATKPANCIGLASQSTIDLGPTPHLHQFHLTGLSPNTTYYYAITQHGQQFDGGGACYTLRTMPAGAVPPAPLVIAGKLLLWPACTTPVTTGAVYVQITRPGLYPFSTWSTVHADGTFALNVSPAALATGTWWTPQSGDSINLIAASGDLGKQIIQSWDGLTNPVVLSTACINTNATIHRTLDASFEASTTAAIWQPRAGTTVDATPANAHTFSHALLLTGTGTESAPNAFQDISVFPGARYQLSGWFNQDTANAGTIAAYDSTSGSPTTLLATTTPFTDTGVYRLATATFTAPAGVTRLRLEINNLVSAAHVHVDDVLLTVLPAQLGNTGGEVSSTLYGWNVTTGSTYPTASLATTGCHSGARCFQLVSTTPAQNAVPPLYQDITTIPGVPYRVGGWLEQDTTQNPYLGVYDTDGNTLSNPVWGTRVNETGVWRQQQFLVTPQQTGIRVMMNQSTTGTSLLDDLSVTAMPGFLGNGGFETPDPAGSGWVLPGGGIIDTTAADAHTGSRSLKNVVTASSGQDTVQDIPVFAGMPYTVAASLKQTSGTSGGSLKVQCATDLSTIAQSPVPGTAPASYAPQSLPFTVPSTCTTIRLSLAQNQPGTYFWDDVSLIPQPGKIGNAGFEQDTTGAGWLLPSTGSIVASGAYAGSNAFMNTGAATAASWAYQDLPVTPGALYSVGMEAKGTNQYLTVDCVPSYGATTGAIAEAWSSQVSNPAYAMITTSSFTVPATGCPYVRVMLEQAAGITTGYWDSGSAILLRHMSTRRTHRHTTAPRAVAPTVTNPLHLVAGLADTVHVFRSIRPANLPTSLAVVPDGLEQVSPPSDTSSTPLPVTPVPSTPMPLTPLPITTSP